MQTHTISHKIRALPESRWRAAMIYGPQLLHSPPFCSLPTSLVSFAPWEMQMLSCVEHCRMWVCLFLLLGGCGRHKHKQRQRWDGKQPLHSGGRAQGYQLAGPLCQGACQTPGYYDWRSPLLICVESVWAHKPHARSSKHVGGLVFCGWRRVCACVHTLSPETLFQQLNYSSSNCHHLPVLPLIKLDDREF